MDGEIVKIFKTTYDVEMTSEKKVNLGVWQGAKIRSALNSAIARRYCDNIQYEKLVEMINKIEAFKQEIETIYAENEELEKEKKDLKAKLKMYYNLPIDINQMQQLIDIKKEEYQILLKTKH